MMKKQRGRPVARKGDLVHARVYFHRKDFELLTAAARRRGLSNQEFIRLACNVIAAKVMAAPLDDALGLDVSASSNAEAAA